MCMAVAGSLLSVWGASDGGAKQCTDIATTLRYFFAADRLVAEIDPERNRICSECRRILHRNNPGATQAGFQGGWSLRKPSLVIPSWQVSPSCDRHRRSVARVRSRGAGASGRFVRFQRWLSGLYRPESAPSTVLPESPNQSLALRRCRPDSTIATRCWAPTSKRRTGSLGQGAYYPVRERARAWNSLIGTPIYIDRVRTRNPKRSPFGLHRMVGYAGLSRRHPADRPRAPPTDRRRLHLRARFWCGDVQVGQGSLGRAVVDDPNPGRMAR